MSGQTKIGLIAVALIVVLGGGAYAATHLGHKPAPAAAQKIQTPPPSAATQLLYQGVEGKTALELLRAKDPSAKTTGDGANAYVTSLEGYTANTSKKEYWALFVNGKMSDVGAGSYVTKTGDQLRWEIQTY